MAAKSKSESITLPKYPAADCENCPLKKYHSANPEVIGIGESSFIAFVGEGPGREEVYQRKVFSGPTGQILRAVINDLGLDKYTPYLTNSLMCDSSAIEKESSEWYKAIDSCRPRLIRELKEVSPELVVVMGNAALETISPNERRRIMSLSGELDHSDELDMDILYTFHPAFILHSREGERYFSQWVDHINEARLYFEAEPIDTESIVIDSVESLMSALEDLEDDELIALDVETTSFSPYDVGWGITPDGRYFDYGRLLCIAVCGKASKSYVITPSVFEDENGREALARFLLSHKILCHNAAFDLPFIWEYITPGVYAAEDTMIKDYARDETPFHSLKRLGRKHLGVEDWSEVNAPYLEDRSSSYANIPTEILYPYCGLDTSVTRKLPDYIVLDEYEEEAYRNVLLPLTNMFLEQSVQGILIDPKALVNAAKILGSQKETAHNFLYKEYGVSNPNSWKQIFNVLWDQLDLDIPEEAKTGKAYLESLLIDERYRNEVESWEWEASEFARVVMEYRGATKARNTYIKDVARNFYVGDYCVHPDYKLFSQVNGRITISNPGLTNYTKAKANADLIRSPFVARPGYVWLHYDYKQMELRVYAARSGDRKLKEIFKERRDPHHEVALNIWDDYVEENEKRYGLLRTVCKTCVFGRLYGRGAWAMAEQLEVPVEETERVCRVIDSYFSNLQDYRDWITKDLMEQQEIITPFGRKRRFPLITEDNYHRCFNQACNSYIQSTASDLNLLALKRVRDELGHDKKLYSRFTIHDSGELEILESAAGELIPVVLQILQEEPARLLGTPDIPFELDYVVGDRWLAK